MNDENIKYYYNEFTREYLMLTKKEIDHLIKFFIKEECNRLKIRLRKIYSNKLIRQEMVGKLS